MPDDPLAPDSGADDDLLDPHLVEEFRRLETLTPPDTWARISAGTERHHDRQPVFGVDRRSALLVAAVAVAVAGVAALQIGSSPSTEVDVANEPTVSAPTETTPEGYRFRPDVTVVDGMAIADLRLGDGGGLRLSLPEELATDLRFVPTDSIEPVRLESEEASVEILFSGCSTALALNEQGAAIEVEGDTVTFCRDDAVLRATLTTDLTVDQDDLDAFDIRPIAVSGAYARALVGRWPQLKNCGNCAPWGPITFPDDGVIVARVRPNEIEAISRDTLEPVWSTDTGGREAALHGGPGGVYVEAIGASFRNLDPATGEERWRIELDPGEQSLALDVVAADIAVLRTSFGSDGDTTAPLLRRIDTETGAVLWTRSGREGTRWGNEPAIGIDGLIVLTDDPSSGAGRGDVSTVWAFDADDGTIVWSSELESSEAIFTGSATTTLAFEFGPALLARSAGGDVQRIDPATGEVLWRTEGLRAEITGTQFAREGLLAIDLATPNGQRLLDPSTGRELTVIGTDMPPSCPVTAPFEPAFVPPEPWPASPSADHLVWYGTSDLWTVIDRSGRTPRKAVFWSANFPGGAVEERPELEVTYRQLGPDESLIEFDAPGTNAYTPEDGDFMINGIEPDTPGCWLVTASYKGATLSYVYEVV